MTVPIVNAYINFSTGPSFAQAMIYVINFFNSRMATMSNSHRNKVKEVIGLHEIGTSELVNKYLELVLENS